MSLCAALMWGLMKSSLGSSVTFLNRNATPPSASSGVEPRATPCHAHSSALGSMIDTSAPTSSSLGSRSGSKGSTTRWEDPFLKKACSDSPSGAKHTAFTRLRHSSSQNSE